MTAINLQLLPQNKSAVIESNILSAYKLTAALLS
jgi:hypothetical protein